MTAYILQVLRSGREMPTLYIADDGTPVDCIEQAEIFATATEACCAALGLAYRVEWRCVGGPAPVKRATLHNKERIH